MPRVCRAFRLQIWKFLTSYSCNVTKYREDAGTAALFGSAKSMPVSQIAKYGSFSLWLNQCLTKYRKGAPDSSLVCSAQNMPVSQMAKIWKSHSLTQPVSWQQPCLLSSKYGRFYLWLKQWLTKYRSWIGIWKVLLSLTPFSYNSKLHHTLKIPLYKVWWWVILPFMLLFQFRLTSRFIFTDDSG